MPSVNKKERARRGPADAQTYVDMWPRSEDGKKGGDKGKTMVTRAKALGAMVPQAKPDAPSSQQGHMSTYALQGGRTTRRRFQRVTLCRSG